MPRSADRIRARVVAAALVAILATAVLTGCSDLYFDRRETISLGAGDDVAINLVTHMVDPWPPAAANRNIAYNGDKMQSAAARYRTGKIIQPKGLGTTSSWGQTQTESGGATDSDIGAAKSAAGK
jgi:hypothetical protein